MSQYGIISWNCHAFIFFSVCIVRYGLMLHFFFFALVFLHHFSFSSCLCELMLICLLFHCSLIASIIAVIAGAWFDLHCSTLAAYFRKESGLLAFWVQALASNQQNGCERLGGNRHEGGGHYNNAVWKEGYRADGRRI